MNKNKQGFALGNKYFCHASAKVLQSCFDVNSWRFVRSCVQIFKYSHVYDE